MNIDINDFIKSFEEKLKSVFYERADISQFSIQRGIPPHVMREIMSDNPLSVAIPKQYGGRGVQVKECLRLLSSASYESLSLSLTLGINIALFLEPISKYAKESVKGNIFKRFIEKQNMGGLMITEPDFGSDALSMQTSNVNKGDNYHLKGVKHWQGLTGMADYWLMTSRSKNDKGVLGRDIDFFICDVTQHGQQIVVEEYFDNLGLYMIPYGRNIIDITVSKDYKLQPETTGIKMLLDILHRSRMQFPGMAMGFIKRMLDESIKHCKQRIVGNKNLFSLDQVQFQISKIQTAYTISSAMCFKSSLYSGIENNLSLDSVEANSMKTVVADLMQESAQIATQLFGAKGFRVSNIAGRGIVDSRPFQIFEGSNEMLYTQISESIIKMMKRKKEFNLFNFLSSYDLTVKSIEFFKKETNFTLDVDLAQRKLVELGSAIGRIISLGFVIEMGDSGYRKDLINNCILSLQQDVSNLINSFNFYNNNKVITDYQEGSSWFDYV